MKSYFLFAIVVVLQYHRCILTSDSFVAAIDLANVGEDIVKEIFVVDAGEDGADPTPSPIVWEPELFVSLSPFFNAFYSFSQQKVIHL